MSNAISWFEIPVTNYERAKKFYNTILAIAIEDSPMPTGQYGVFPYDSDNNSVSGALIEVPEHRATTNGVLIYLNGGDDLNTPLARITAAGGTIVLPKTDIGENGYIAKFTDSEGNTIALHSWN